MNNKTILIMIVYEIVYWIVWLGFIYGIIKLSNNFGFLWVLIVPCLMMSFPSNKKEDKESDEW